MSKNSTKGLVALGLAALAYWQFKMTPEDKAKLKDQVGSAGKKLMDKIPQDLKDAGNRVKETASNLGNKLNNKAEHTTDQLS